MSILPGWIPPRPSRHLLLRMLVVVSVLALHLTMWGHAIDSLYLEYPSADKARKTVIINTLEIPEIQKVADRCVVFYEGKIVKIFDHNEVNEHNVMMYSTNAIETIREAQKP